MACSESVLLEETINGKMDSSVAVTPGSGEDSTSPVFKDLEKPGSVCSFETAITGQPASDERIFDGDSMPALSPPPTLMIDETSKDQCEPDQCEPACTESTQRKQNSSTKTAHGPPLLEPEVIQIDDDDDDDSVCVYEEPPMLLPEVALTRKRKGIIRKRTFFGDTVSSDQPSLETCQKKKSPKSIEIKVLKPRSPPSVSRMKTNQKPCTDVQNVRRKLSFVAKTKTASIALRTTERSQDTEQKTIVVRMKPQVRRMGSNMKTYRRSGTLPASRCGGQRFAVSSSSQRVFSDAPLATGWRSNVPVQPDEVSARCGYSDISGQAREAFAPVTKPGSLVKANHDADMSERSLNVCGDETPPPEGVFASTVLDEYLEKRSFVQLSFPVPDCLMPREKARDDEVKAPPPPPIPPTVKRHPDEPRFKTLLEKQVWYGLKPESDLLSARLASSPIAKSPAAQEADTCESHPLYALLRPPRYLSPARATRNLSVHRFSHLLPLSKVMHDSLDVRRAWDNPDRTADCVQYAYDQNRQVRIRGSVKTAEGPTAKAYGRLVRPDSVSAGLDAWQRQSFSLATEVVDRQKALIVAATVHVSPAPVVKSPCKTQQPLISPQKSSTSPDCKRASRGGLETSKETEQKNIPVLDVDKCHITEDFSRFLPDLQLGGDKQDSDFATDDEEEALVIDLDSSTKPSTDEWKSSVEDRQENSSFENKEEASGKNQPEKSVIDRWDESVADSVEHEESDKAFPDWKMKTADDEESFACSPQTGAIHQHPSAHNLPMERGGVVDQVQPNTTQTDSASDELIDLFVREGTDPEVEKNDPRGKKLSSHIQETPTSHLEAVEQGTIADAQRDVEDEKDVAGRGSTKLIDFDNETELDEEMNRDAFSSPAPLKRMSSREAEVQACLGPDTLEDLSAMADVLGSDGCEETQNGEDRNIERFSGHASKEEDLCEGEECEENCRQNVADKTFPGGTLLEKTHPEVDGTLKENWMPSSPDISLNDEDNYKQSEDASSDANNLQDMKSGPPDNGSVTMEDLITDNILCPKGTECERDGTEREIYHLDGAGPSHETEHPHYTASQLPIKQQDLSSSQKVLDAPSDTSLGDHGLICEGASQANSETLPKIFSENRASQTIQCESIGDENLDKCSELLQEVSPEQKLQNREQEEDFSKALLDAIKSKVMKQVSVEDIRKVKSAGCVKSEQKGSGTPPENSDSRASDHLSSFRALIEKGAHRHQATEQQTSAEVDICKERAKNAQNCESEYVFSPSGGMGSDEFQENRIIIKDRKDRDGLNQELGEEQALINLEENGAKGRSKYLENCSNNQLPQMLHSSKSSIKEEKDFRREENVCCQGSESVDPNLSEFSNSRPHCKLLSWRSSNEKESWMSPSGGALKQSWNTPVEDDLNSEEDVSCNVLNDKDTEGDTKVFESSDGRPPRRLQSWMSSMNKEDHYNDHKSVNSSLEKVNAVLQKDDKLAMEKDPSSDAVLSMKEKVCIKEEASVESSDLLPSSLNNESNTQDEDSKGGDWCLPSLKMSRRACVHLPRLQLTGVHPYCVFHEVHGCPEYRPGGSCYMIRPFWRLPQQRRDLAIRSGRLPPLRARHIHSARTFGRVKPPPSLKPLPQPPPDSCVAVIPGEDGTDIQVAPSSGPREFPLSDDVDINHVTKVIKLIPADAPDDSSSVFVVRLQNGSLARIGSRTMNPGVNFRMQAADSSIVVTSADGRRFRNPPGHRCWVDIESSPGELCRASLAHLNRSLNSGFLVISTSDGGVSLAPARMRARCKQRLRRVGTKVTAMFSDGCVVMRRDDAGQLTIIGAIKRGVARGEDGMLVATDEKTTTSTDAAASANSEDLAKWSAPTNTKKSVNKDGVKKSPKETAQSKKSAGNTAVRTVVLTPGCKRAASCDTKQDGEKRPRLSSVELEQASSAASRGGQLGPHQFNTSQQGKGAKKSAAAASQPRSTNGRFQRKERDPTPVAVKFIRDPANKLVPTKVKVCVFKPRAAQQTNGSDEMPRTDKSFENLTVGGTRKASNPTRRFTPVGLSKSGLPPVPTPSERPATKPPSPHVTVSAVGSSPKKRSLSGPSVISAIRQKRKIAVTPGGPPPLPPDCLALVKKRSSLEIFPVPSTGVSDDDAGQLPKPLRRVFHAEASKSSEPCSAALPASAPGPSKQLKKPFWRKVYPTKVVNVPYVGRRRSWADQPATRRSWEDLDPPPEAVVLSVPRRGSAEAGLSAPGSGEAILRGYLGGSSPARRGSGDASSCLPSLSCHAPAVGPAGDRLAAPLGSGGSQPARRSSGDPAPRQSWRDERPPPPPPPALLRCDGVSVRRWPGPDSSVSSRPAPSVVDLTGPQDSPPGAEPATVDLTSPRGSPEKSAAPPSGRKSRRNPVLPLEVTLMDEDDLADDALEDLIEAVAVREPSPASADDSLIASIPLIEL